MQATHRRMRPANIAHCPSPLPFRPHQRALLEPRRLDGANTGSSRWSRMTSSIFFGRLEKTKNNLVWAIPGRQGRRGKGQAATIGRSGRERTVRAPTSHPFCVGIDAPIAPQKWDVILAFEVCQTTSRKTRRKNEVSFCGHDARHHEIAPPDSKSN